MSPSTLLTSRTNGQLADRRITLLLQPGESLAKRLGVSPSTRLVDVGIVSAMTIKNGRRLVEVRRGQ